MRKRSALKLCCAALFCLALCLDRMSKDYVTANLSEYVHADFLPPLFDLYRTRNYGGAWSSFAGATAFLIAVTSIGMLALLWVGVRCVRHPLGCLALSSVLGGGIGNLIDRLRWGYVVDMIDCMFIDYPVFNVADCFIVVGAVLGAVYYLFFYEKYDGGGSHGHRSARR